MAIDGLFLGGILNVTDPIIGFQLYKWSWLMLLIFAGVIWLAFRYGQWEAYRPLWGMYYAFKAKSKAAFIFNRRMHAELVSEASAKCIFDYKTWFKESGPVKYDFENNVFEPVTPWPGPLSKIQALIWYYPCAFLDIDPLMGALYKFGGSNHDVDIAKKMQNYEWDDAHSVTSGGILIDIILDADNWSVPTSPQHRTLERLAEQWNEANPKDQIHAYPKLQRFFTEGTLEVPKGIKFCETVPWPRMDAGCPVDVEDNAMDGARRQEEAEDEEKQAEPFQKYYFPMLMCGLGLALLIVMLKFILKFTS